MREPPISIVVVGASVGGLDALRALLAELPSDIAASVLVTMHLAPDRESLLPRLLAPYTQLALSTARDGDPIEPGRVLFAPPDHHLLIHRDHVRVVRGPRENGHRPAIDPMFRSAAIAWGRRVIGVVLTGALDDGTAGLVTVKRHGGLAIVQDPREAYEPQMPRNALENVPVDHCLDLSSIARALPLEARVRAREPLPRASDPVAAYESAAAGFDTRALESTHKPGVPSVYSCPDCSGVLAEIHEGEQPRFRCQVGHAFTLDGLLQAQDHAIERALWVSLRALLEKRNLARRIAGRPHAYGLDASVEERARERLSELERNIEILRALLLGDVSRHAGTAGEGSVLQPGNADLPASVQRAPHPSELEQRSSEAGSTEQKRRAARAD